MSNLVIRKVTGISEFESLREIWDELLEKSPDKNIYLTWEWLFTWWKHYGEDRRLNILLIQDNSQIIGIVPLMRLKYKIGFLGFNLLENIGAPTCDYGGIILAQKEREAMLALMNYFEGEIADCNTIIRLNQIPKDSEFFLLIKQSYPSSLSSMLISKREICLSPYLPLTTTWDEYFHSHSRKRRGNLKRALKQLEQKYDVKYERYNAVNQAEYGVDKFLKLKQKRLESKKLKGVWYDQRTRDFYTDVANAFARRGWLDLSLLTADGKPLSAVYGFRYGGRFYYTNTAFDPEYSEYSPGNLHIMYLIKDMFGNGLREFDFLRGDEAYKLIWTKVARSNFEVMIIKKTFMAPMKVKLIRTILRLDEIYKRSLLENYSLYLDRKREQKAKNRIGK